MEIHNSTLESIYSYLSGMISDPGDLENTYHLFPDPTENITPTDNLSQTLHKFETQALVLPYPSPIIKTKTLNPSTYTTISLNAPENQKDLPPTTRQVFIGYSQNEPYQDSEINRFILCFSGMC